MICAGTILRLYDNSGVKRVKVLKGPHKHFLPGNIITVTIKRVVPKRFRSKRKEIKKGELHKILLTSMSTKLHRRTGSYLSGPFNAGVLLRKEDIQLTYANRLKRPVYRECRNHSKILAIAPNIY